MMARSWLVAAPVLPYRYFGPVEGRIVDIDRSFSDAVRLTLDRVAMPGLTDAVPPARVEETLARTGNLVLGPGRTRYDKLLAVFEEGTRTVLKLSADFVPAEWIDRAVVMYGNEPGPLPVSSLRLVDSQRDALGAHFAGMTPLAALAYGAPATS